MKRLRSAARICSVLVVLLASLGSAAEARSPVPYFKGVERMAVFCGRPADRDLRARLCEEAQSVLSALVAQPVAVGAAGFRDPKTLTVLVNGHEVEGPDGALLVVSVDLLRKDHVDPRLFGATPIVLPVGGVETSLKGFAGKLTALLSEIVLGPWRTANPRERSPGKDG
jgi:hypothetical protein